MLSKLRTVFTFFGESQKGATIESLDKNKNSESGPDEQDWQTVSANMSPIVDNNNNEDKKCDKKAPTTTTTTSRNANNNDTANDNVKLEPARKSSQSLLANFWNSKIKKEYVVMADISNGNERYKIPALSYKPNDKAPDDYHYVCDYVESKPLYIDRSLLYLSHCKCSNEEMCNSGYCDCSGNYHSGRYYNSRGLLSSDYNFLNPYVIFECNASCLCNKSACKNMVIQKGCQLKLVLCRTKSRGWGVRTLEPLRKGSFVGIYSGELISGMESLKRKDDTYLFNLSTNDISSQQTSEAQNNQQETTVDGNAADALTKDVRQFVCDAKYFGNFTRFINHSCEPNVIGIRSFTQHHDKRFPYIAFFTNQDIQANRELTLNYGDNYWLIKCRRDKIYCLCKRSKCRFNKRTFSHTLKAYNEQRSNN